ncbi:MAG: hypothetical protein ACWGNV_11595, partial [Bacteroidales bacterium]
MRLYRFEKWYADLLTSQRDYIIIFHTLLEILGMKICFVEVNLSRFKREQDFHINRRLRRIKRSGHAVFTEKGHIRYDEERGEIRLFLKELELELNIEPVHPPDLHVEGMRIDSGGGGYLIWKPLYLKADIEGRMLFKGKGVEGKGEKAFSGKGYVDYLFSCMSPLRVPVRRLYWGRLHSQDIDLTYSYALGIHEEICGAKMMICIRGERIWLNVSKFRAEQWQQWEPPGISCPGSYLMKAGTERIQLALFVTHLKPAVISEFLEGPEELGRISRTVVRWISTEPKGIKFYATANLECTLDGETRKLEEIFMKGEISLPLAVQQYLFSPIERGGKFSIFKKINLMFLTPRWIRKWTSKIIYQDYTLIDETLRW